MLLELVADGVARGMAPTIRELADLLGLRSTNGVTDHIKWLEKKGFIERVPRISRGLRVTPAGYEAIGRAGACNPTCPTCKRPL
jgi:repressor LexA